VRVNIKEKIVDILDCHLKILMAQLVWQSYFRIEFIELDVIPNYGHIRC